jgi:hypothetical protein
MCADASLVARAICGLTHYNAPKTNKLLSRVGKTIPALKIDQVTVKEFASHSFDFST